MPTLVTPIEVPFEVWCTCGEGLCLTVEVVPEGREIWADSSYSRGLALVIPPCKKCCKKKTTKKKRAEGA